MPDREYQWSPDDRPPPDEDAAAAAHLHGFLEYAAQHFSVQHAVRPLTPAQQFNGVLQFAACAIDTLALREAAGDAEDHVGTLLMALGAFYRMLAAYAPRPLPWPDRPPGAEEAP